MGLTTSLAFTCRSCPCNAHNALCNRHGRQQPEMAADFSDAYVYLDNVYSKIRLAYAHAMTTWLTGWLVKWPLAKQLAIVASQIWDAVTPARLHVMVKRESGHAMPTKARLIQYYPNLATQAAFGPEFFSLQKAYTAHFQRAEVFPGITLTFGSSLNADGLGEWMRASLDARPNAHFYERDGKNWDSTMQRAHHELRKYAYRPAGPEFGEFVERGYDATANLARHALKYRIVGTVKSGHNDTTLGNSLNNGFIATLSMRALGLRGDVIVTGDDLLCVIAGDFDADALAREEARYGIVPEYAKFNSVFDVSFISGVWVPHGDTFLFTSKPGRLLARLFWTTRPPPPRRKQEYLNGVVLGLRPTCGSLPVIGAFLDAHYDPRYAADEVVQWKYRVQHETAFGQLARGPLETFFSLRYGLSLTDIHDAERLIRSARGVVGFIKHPALDRILEVDLADVTDRPKYHSS